MNSVFVLQHLYTLPNGEEDVKLIGVYTSREAACRAIERLRIRPGFRDFPDIVNPDESESPDGFYIDEYPLDRDFWQEGFVTL